MTVSSLSALVIGTALALGAGDGDAPATKAAPSAAEGIALRGKAELGQTTKVKRTLAAEGTIRASSGDSKLGIPATPPLKLKVEAKVEYDERAASVSPDGSVAKSARRMRQAAVQIGGDVRQATLTLRPKVATVVAERRGREVFLYSNGGPLTRQELDLIRGPGDSMGWVDLLPEGPVKVGESWDIGESTARELSDYDALASNGLKGTLESADEASAKIRFRGAVRGIARGGEGTISVAGLAVIDRKTGMVKRLVVNRNEVRGSGPVETALELKSTLTVESEPVSQTPSDLDNPTLASLPAKPPRDWEQLLYEAPNKKYVLRHDRAWHLFWDDSKIAVFKRLDNGELVAQCNIAEGPNAGPGKHQDVEQFQTDIKKALGPRFVQVLGEGEIAAPGSFLYKVGVEGKESVKVEGKDAQVAINWFYYLVASPRGDQLLLTFTLGQAQAKAFADGDEVLAKGLEWLEPPAK